MVELKIFETSQKLTRSDAIFEFSTSSNTFLNVTIECREIYLGSPSWFPNTTSYFPFQMRYTDEIFSCVERGLTESCITTIEGKKCSLKLKISILFQPN